jgi:hypothetical protein
MSNFELIVVILLNLMILQKWIIIENLKKKQP